jgi:hypothetical protein
MKPNLIATTAAPLLLLIAWLLIPQTAHCFYNPSTGRWLSRDPIEEGGSKNLYCFAENRPVIAFDLDGRMTLREFPKELPASPTTGPYAGYDGLTWFNAFEPDAKVYEGINAPCCWKIFLPGHADLYYWWVKNAPGHAPGATAKDHELQHAAIHRDTYNGFNASASDYVGVCFSKGKAECWKSIINGPLKAAYLAHNHTANLQIDAWYRGSEIPAAIQAENVAWDTLAKEEDKCASME